MNQIFNRPFFKPLIYLTLLISFNLLTSCFSGMVKFAYNNADYFIEREVDKFLKLTSEQSDVLSVGVEDFIEWHREGELEPLSDLLGQINEKFTQATLTEKEVDEITNYSLQIRNRTLLKFLDEISPALVDLTDEQLAILEKKLEKRQKIKLGSDDKTFLERTDEENTDYYTEKRKEQLYDWLGEVTPEQVQLIRDYPIYDRELFQLRQENREVFRKKTIAFLKSKPSQLEIKETFFKWVKHPELIRTAEYHRIQSARIKQFYGSFISWHQSLTAKQKENFNEELMYYKDIIDDLRS